MLWFDEYERRARVAPGLLAVLPIAVVGVILGLHENAVVGSLLGLLTAAGGPLVLASYVRQRGRDLQAKLSGQWGGMPATTLLRLTVPTDNEALREQRRSTVERLAGVTLPSADEERRDAQRASQRIEAAIAAAREQTRDQQRFPLVFAENRTYGFERNLLAVRPLGLAVTALSLTLLGVTAAIVMLREFSASSLISIGLGAVFVSLFGMIWWLYPTEDRVWQAGYRYASALLDAASIA